MSDGRSPEATDPAQAGPASDAGWEPADWRDRLRRRRCRQLATAIGLVVLIGVVAPLLRVTLDRPPSVTYWIWAFLTLVYVVEAAYSWISPAGRARWEQETREQVRVSHALRHHVGIGTADRALVTERARTMNTWSKVAFVGWPLLGVVFVAGILDDRVPASLAVPVVLLCLLLVGRAVRKARLARRWLADPLPRDA